VPRPSSLLGPGFSSAERENGRIKRFTDYYDLASYFPKVPAVQPLPAK
jgi:hypothetical protein